MKHVLIASDSFKGTLSSSDIVEIAKRLVEKKYSKDIILDLQALGDGGEGSLEAVASIKGGDILQIKTFDAEMHPINAPLLLFDKGDSAFIEVASVVGLPLIKGDVDPLDRTTKGLGVLIKEAIACGVKRIYVGLGGSSTNDLGIGTLQELGLDFGLGHVIAIKDALEVKKLEKEAFEKAISGVEFICLSDVSNPLLGKRGATYVYGRQKGYGDCLPFLEERMGHLAKLFERKLGLPFASSLGAGAAGGLGGAFLSFFKAKMESGIDTLLLWANMEQRVKQADLLISGEGCFDEQSLNGKLLSGILEICPKEKLYLIVGKSTFVQSGLHVYQTSKPGESYEEIKLNARQEYENALDKVLSEFISKDA